MERGENWGEKDGEGEKKINSIIRASEGEWWWDWKWATLVREGVCLRGLIGGVGSKKLNGVEGF